MKIEVITMWYNEEVLAPLFLDHYKWADKIHVIIDADTSDRCAEIACKHNNVDLHLFRFPDGLDDRLLIDEQNRLAGTLDCDWVITADADEFLFPLPEEPIKDWIGREIAPETNVIKANIWQVYRHESEQPIDPTLPALHQRRHGDPDMRGKNALYFKPCIVKPGYDIMWWVGCHTLQRSDRIVIGETKLYGTHWAMADVDLALNRRLRGRKERMSQQNHKNRLSKHNHKITESQIRAVCEQRKESPRLF